MGKYTWDKDSQVSIIVQITIECNLEFSPRGLWCEAKKLHALGETGSSVSVNKEQCSHCKPIWVLLIVCGASFVHRMTCKSKTVFPIELF